MVIKEHENKTKLIRIKREGARNHLDRELRISECCRRGCAAEVTTPEAVIYTGGRREPPHVSRAARARYLFYRILKDLLVSPLPDFLEVRPLVNLSPIHESLSLAL